MDFICKYCNKTYKTQQSRSNHYRIYHTTESPICQPSVIPLLTIVQPNVNPMSPQSKHNYTCDKCNVNFTTRQAKSRHINKSCKNKNDIIEKNNTIDELKKENSEIKNTLNELLKLCKIHPKTLQKINKNLINNTNSNNTNNGTINNGTINIVKFGSEDLASILSKSEIFKILNRKLSSLEESIKLIHFNNDRPELKNIYITNLKDPYAYSYDGNKFVASLKSDMLSELVDNHIENIEYSLEEYKDKLQPKTVEVLDKFIDKMNEDDEEFIDKEHRKTYPNYKSFNINKIKMMIYNESNKNVVSVIYDKNELPYEESSTLSSTLNESSALGEPSTFDETSTLGEPSTLPSTVPLV